MTTPKGTMNPLLKESIRDYVEQRDALDVVWASLLDEVRAAIDSGECSLTGVARELGVPVTTLHYQVHAGAATC